MSTHSPRKEQASQQADRDGKAQHASPCGQHVPQNQLVFPSGAAQTNTEQSVVTALPSVFYLMKRGSAIRVTNATVQLWQNKLCLSSSPPDGWLGWDPTRLEDVCDAKAARGKMHLPESRGETDT